MKMGKKVREYKSGDFIFAKVKGYPAWPARVQKPNGKKYFVYFYGTGETANLPPNMIFDYAENKEKFLNKSVKRKDFNDGVRQIDHDFANNVPLEQVIGALAADAEPAPVDDTLNDSANDTVDDSAMADTTADETMDETANSTAVNDGPVEDSDETGALVIDEGKQKGRKSTAKTPATPKPAKEGKGRGRPRKEEAKEVKEAEPEEEKKDEEIVSRSGRKIRPKRYMDEQTEENATLPSPAPKKRRAASPTVEKPAEPKEKEKPQDKNLKAYNTVQQSELRELKEPFKSADPERENILITYLPSGAYCGVKLFQSRPASFKNEASRLQWDRQAAANAITLKRQLEKGQITPQSISAQLVMDLNLTDEQKAMLDKDRDLEIKKSRLHFLKTEMKLIELDAKIKTCLSLEKADTELCLKLIDEILELDLAALMLLKHPTCMETVKRMRVYVGNAPSWEMSESEALTFSKQAHRIRNKADALFITMRDLFDVPEGLSFWEFFNERVAQFKTVTADLHADKLLEMVHEPIEMTQPSSHTMKAAIDAANDDDAAEPEEAAQKKKPAAAKGKKANSTPAKTPLKRQSSRKQQNEDKEKETEQEPEKPAEEPTEPDTNNKDADKPDTNDAPKENNDSEEADAEKTNDVETEEADKEVEKVNDNAEKSDKEPDTPTEDEKGQGDSEKPEEDTKDKEANSKEKADEAKSKPESSKEKTDEKEKDNEEKEKPPKESKKPKEDKNSNGDKNSKSKDKKDDAKNSKDAKNVKAGDKRKDKKEEKEKSEEKEKVDVDEPRAKRSRESKKTEPPPRSPAKRKSKS